MITEYAFEQLYQWAHGNHEGFTCKFCGKHVPAGEKHIIHLTKRDEYASCETPDKAAAPQKETT